MPALWWFAETTLVAGVLAVIAASCSRIKRLDAATRHLLWFLVLVKLLLPPVLRSPWPLTLPALAAVAPGTAATPANEPAGPMEAAPEPADVPPSEHADFRVVLASAELPAEEPDDEPMPADLRPPEPSARPAIPPPAPGRPWIRSLPDPSWLVYAWVAVAAAIAGREAVRIVRFRRRLAQAVPAPEWLVAEVERLAARLEVNPPETLAVPGLATPLVWCLARPRLLLPGHLVKSLGADQWRGILAHELAHLRRGDQWVGRLELVAGLVWWWNPIYWLARRRLDAEAELACDAEVVRALPGDRLTYAEVLFQICSDLSLAGSPSPALGVVGSGRFFERRLQMILDDRAPRRRSFTVLLAICLLALLAAPSWTASTSAAPILVEPTPLPSVGEPPEGSDDARVQDDEDDDDEDDADDADDDDAEDDDDRAKSKDKAPKHESGRQKAGKPGKGDVKDKDIEKLVESALGPDFEKKMEAFGKEIQKKFGDGSDFEKKMEAFSKEIEKRFGDGSEFAKKMEAFGKEMEEKFGDNSEFAKKMEAMGKEMEKKFGDESEFAKKMEAMGKEMEKKFGPGSDFAKEMEKKFGEDSKFAKEMEKKFGEDSDFAKEMEKKFGADSKFAREMKELAKQKEKQAKDKQKAEKDDEARHSADRRPEAKAHGRKDRIKSLETQIQKLMKELKDLEAEGQE